MSHSTANVMPFFDAATFTVSYLVYDCVGGRAAIIDPVLDYDAKSGRTSTKNAQKILEAVRELNLTVDWILETHAHADHVSAAAWLQMQIGGKIAIGQGIDQVQQIFKPMFGLEPDFATDGRQFDHLFVAGERFSIGLLSAEILFVPGHTPADVAYLIGDALFVGDTIFMPDVGTARCDFPGGDAGTLFDSVQQLYALPDRTRVFVCHDYLPENRVQYQWETTIAAQKQHNVHIRIDTLRDDFIALRQARDKTLAVPALILPSIQINIRAGHLPPADVNGKQFLKIPLNVL
ncbi:MULTISPECIES: MBL fold metallo-hydrolase [Deefgea]|uniref:MBL fold metallo-hydrolase n=1 Tax=Deefgea chitinilytica TaxID=570276 RepID=A0ABS2C9N7_9NEIS|nr:MULTISPECIES: MBL fold metallo-hydrolase [Deefgea]MBM5570859.1 MBL fold metallo-hydrolase [Deefgea chitinilytica]MBM9888088.1 MBL fold metallo-hydrolase [Deefgea sp. CFH1-16]